MAERRKLDFPTLDAAVADARHLYVAGYTHLGNWSLGQVCGHLTYYVEMPLGKPVKLSGAARVMGFVLRKTFGPGYKRKMLATRSIPAGQPTLKSTVPSATADDLKELTRFEAAVSELKAFSGTPVASTLFGPMTTAELVELTCVHAAHHLSFLIPNDTLQAPTRN